MTNSPVFLTPAGKAKLEAELEELKGPRRQELAKRLKAAIEMGDLSENADYKAAKEDQGFLEGRIQEIQNILSKAEIADLTDIKEGIVQIGSTVVIQEAEDPEETFTIVGAKEANAREGKISYESPLGSALLGKQAGDKVLVNVKADISYTVTIKKIV
jgi:transcription elongation factor GreA